MQQNRTAPEEWERHAMAPQGAKGLEGRFEMRERIEKMCKKNKKRGKKEQRKERLRKRTKKKMRTRRSWVALKKKCTFLPLLWDGFTLMSAENKFR